MRHCGNAGVGPRTGKTERPAHFEQLLEGYNTSDVTRMVWRKNLYLGILLTLETISHLRSAIELVLILNNLNDAQCSGKSNKITTIYVYSVL